MCRTSYFHATCGHNWLHLDHACGPGRNLETCPKFHPGQPAGPIYASRDLGTFGWQHCFLCVDGEGCEYDTRQWRMFIERGRGARVGCCADKRHPGFDVRTPVKNVLCCGIM